MFISKCRWGISFITVFLVMASAAAVAQDYRGKVQGAVMDVNGAAIVGASVMLRNDGTGVEVTRQTNDDGRYIFDFVEPGTYTVTVEQAGYQEVRAEERGRPQPRRRDGGRHAGGRRGRGRGDGRRRRQSRWSSTRAARR